MMRLLSLHVRAKALHVKRIFTLLTSQIQDNPQVRTLQDQALRIRVLRHFLAL